MKRFLKNLPLFLSITSVLLVFGLFQNCGLKGTVKMVSRGGSLLSSVSTNLYYLVTTLAGQSGLSAADARFVNLAGAVFDSSGIMYVADSADHTIRKILPSGVVSTLAGGTGIQGSYDATGTAARFNSPQGVAIDQSYNLLVADTANDIIRKINPISGAVTTLVGTGVGMKSPMGIGVDRYGEIYVADSGNHVIRKFSAAGALLNTVSGFSSPAGMAVYSPVNAFPELYVADKGSNTVKKVTISSMNGVTQFVVSTLATGINAPLGLALDSLKNVYVADSNNSVQKIITPSGAVSPLVVTTGNFTQINWVTVDALDNLYVSDQSIMRSLANGIVTNVAGSASITGHVDVGAVNATGSAANFSNPAGIAVDSAGNVYNTDMLTHVIRKTTQAGVVTTLAGTVGITGSSNGTGAAASFDTPVGIVYDNFSASLYVADSGNCRIRKVTLSGVVTTFAGTGECSYSNTGAGSFSAPVGIAVDSTGNVYVTEEGNHDVRKITRAGVVSTLAGDASVEGGGFANGTGTAATFRMPHALTVDSAGSVYVADLGNHAIRKITASGVVTTLAGNAQGDSGFVDGAGSVAKFNKPAGVAVDSSGNVYVADSENHLIRKITSAGVVSTLAGTATIAGAADGIATMASFHKPFGIAIDSAKNLYVSDYNNNTIRMLKLIY